MFDNISLCNFVDPDLCMCVFVFFYQLFHCYTANFGPIIQVQSHSIDAITGSLVTMLSLAKHLVGFY